MKFSRLTGRNVKVAIIDSGIDPEHEKVKSVESGIQFHATHDGRITELEDHSDCAGHGTACAGIIRKKASHVLLHSVRIFDESLSASGEALIWALRWTIANRMDVVNLSLGSTDVSVVDRLREICKLAVESGVILVAAEHYDGRESYPAVFPEVIGVTGEPVRGRYGYSYREGEIIECVARGDEQRLCWLKPTGVRS